MIYKAKFAIITGFTLASCTHVVQRDPAQVQNKKPVCDQVIESLFSVETLKAQLDSSQVVSEVVSRSIGEKLPLEIREFMSRAGLASNCEDERLVPLYAKDLESRLEYLEDSIANMKSEDGPLALMNSVLFTEKDFGDQLACTMKCQVARSKETMKSNSKKPACTDECKVSAKFNDFYRSFTPAAYLANSCFNEAKGNIDPAEFSGKFNSAKEIFYNQFLKARPQLEGYLPAMELVRLRVSELLAEYKQFQKSRKGIPCAEVRYPWEKLVRKNVVYLGLHSDRGTGFYVRTPGGRYLVTAAHVTDLSPQRPQSEMRFAKEVPEHQFASNVQKTSFLLAPGLNDKDNDVTMKFVNEAGDGLEVVRSDEVPKVGKKFFINGFPGSQGRKYITHQCTFKGFGVGMVNRKEMSYMLECPGKPNLKGISGGPVVDEDGRVWGVNSSTASYSSRMAAVPISINEKGELKAGFQKIFLSDDCYDAHDFAVRRCQVMPKALEENIP